MQAEPKGMCSDIMRRKKKEEVSANIPNDSPKALLEESKARKGNARRQITHLLVARLPAHLACFPLK